ncbi:hypothetical protein ACFVFJ_44690 [Streptomyces sp. NPDC057717]|uniref:hypothetical protein n=1 Tax=unclassified Streptomyces TaxID=2593676 RepID=UPI0036C845F8
MSTSSQTHPPKGEHHLEAERLARQALPIQDPACALVLAQLATAHATLALLDGLNAHRLKVLSDAASFLESKGEAGPGYLLRTCDVPSSEEKDTRELNAHRDDVLRDMAAEIKTLGDERGWSIWAAHYMHPDVEFVDTGAGEKATAAAATATPELFDEEAAE